MLLCVVVGACSTPSQSPPERAPDIDEQEAGSEPVAEPAPEAQPESVPEPQPDPAAEREREPEAEPQPEPTGPAPIEVSEAVYSQTFAEVEGVIEELNDIIHRGDYRRWRSYLTERYIETMSSPATLAELSQSPILRRNDIVLRDLGDYFRYVVGPSRSQSRLDDLVFYSDSVVEALTERDGAMYLLYRLRKVDGQWKIDIF